MKLRHIIIIAIFVGVNVVVLMSLNFGGAEKDDQSEEELFVPTLSAVEIKNGEEQFKISGFGTVSSFNAVDLACEVQGKLNKGKYNLKPGIKFRKGDLLFRINDTDARYNLRSRKSGFINILANLLPDLKVDFPDEFSKWNDYVNSVKLNQRLPQLPAWKTSKEKIFLSTRNVLTEYFAIKSLEEQLDKYAVYAPFSGTITDVYVTDFSVVNPGTRIMRIVETDNFEIPVSVPADQIYGIEIGTEVAIYTTSGDQKGVGNVVRISEVINKTTQSVDVYIRPKSLDGKRFIEGEYVQVEIDKTGVHEGVRIPRNALMDDRVYIYSKKDSSLTLRKVNVLNISEDGAFVTGLEDNSLVISQEVLNYTDTTKYQVLIK